MGSEAFVQFPGMPFRSLEEFHRYRAENRRLFDERYLREQSLGVVGHAVALAGLCAPCLKVTTFVSPTEDGNKTADGRLVPHWRLRQTCGCAFALANHERALLHMALPYLGPSSWSRIGVLGRGENLAARLREEFSQVTLWPRLYNDVFAQINLPTDPASQHVILAADELAHIPPLDQALAAVARSLPPGGLFITTTAFDVEAEETISWTTDLRPVSSGPVLFTRDPVHRLGWDLIPRLRAAGFTDAWGSCYWSEEFGYLGPYNMIFVAFR